VHTAGLSARIRRVKAGLALLLLAGALAVPATTVAAGEARSCRAGVLHRVGTETAAYAGVVHTRAQAYRRPSRRPLARFSRLNQNGYPTTFLIVGAIVTRSCTASWYRVKLPMRPNGVVGYVRPWSVSVRKVRTRIVIDLSRRELTFYRRGRLVLKTPVAVGSAATPTPVGRWYVNQRLIPANPYGAYGPAALGVSAFSDVLTGWVQGGPIGIHGTNAPWSIGRAVSNGCIRVPNSTMQRLFDATPGGTPVVIHP
jgi:lipoprotein-anchoring transpeptidase ErfK/SrfK